MSIKAKILSFLGLVLFVLIVLFFGYPRGLSLIFSYNKVCKVMRAEPFIKGFLLQGVAQANKFSIVCDDGSVCRAEDTGFASVKAGDVIEFRGYPEFSSFEEMFKCEHAQLKRIISAADGPALPQSSPVSSP